MVIIPAVSYQVGKLFARRQVQGQVKKTCVLEVGVDGGFLRRVTGAFVWSFLFFFFFFNKLSITVSDAPVDHPSIIPEQLVSTLQWVGSLVRVYMPANSLISTPSKPPIVTSKMSALFFFTQSLPSLKSNEFLARMVTLSSSIVIFCWMLYKAERILQLLLTL